MASTTIGHTNLLNKKLGLSSQDSPRSIYKSILNQVNQMIETQSTTDSIVAFLLKTLQTTLRYSNLESSLHILKLVIENCDADDRTKYELANQLHAQLLNIINILKKGG